MSSGRTLHIADEQPTPPTFDPQLIHVVGIGANGWESVTDTPRQVIAQADRIIGSTRQLDLLPLSVRGEKIPWPSPLLPAISKLLAEVEPPQLTVVLASGDPMFYGIGNTLVKQFGAAKIKSYPTVSSATLACNELGWPVAETAICSLVTADVSAIARYVQVGEDFLILCQSNATIAQVAQWLCQHGYEHSLLVALSDLGSQHQQIRQGFALNPPQVSSNLVVLAVTPVGPKHGLVPGLPDDLYDHDGQITKQHVRAMTVAALDPLPGTHLWDIGGGSGSIGIEYCRSTPRTTATVFEKNPQRAERIQANASNLVGPYLTMSGAVPESLQTAITDVKHDLAPRPQRVFIGGAVTVDGVIDLAWQALAPGGILVANAVTAESQALVLEWSKQLGGNLITISLGYQHHVGRFTTFQSSLPVMQWKVVKPVLDPRPGDEVATAVA